MTGRSAPCPKSIDRVIVVVNYLAEQIESYLRGQTRLREWTTVRQAEPRGTGDALRSCREQVRSDRFLVLNGDDLYGAADLAALADCPAGVLVYPVDDPPHWGIAFVKPDGTWRSWSKSRSWRGVTWPTPVFTCSRARRSTSR